jgi:MFS family permease
MAMRIGVSARLSTLMALIYAVQGAWWPILALHLGDLGLDGRERGWIFAAYPIAAVFMSLGAGAVVDRLMPSQRYLSICYALGAVFLGAIALGLQTGTPGLFAWFLAYWLITAPTYGISSAMCFRNLKRPDAEFGGVRLWGTVGWMAAGWAVSALMAKTHSRGSGDGVYEAFWVAAACSSALAVFAIFLPNTPPLAVDDRGGRFGGLGPLLRTPSVLVLLVTSFAVSLTTPLVYQAMPTYYEQLGLPRGWAATAATLGQGPEIAALACLPWLFRRLGPKGTLLIGMGAWLLRFTILALKPPLWLAVASIPLHGAGIACFTVAGQVVFDGYAPRDRRAGAQALYAVATSGLGALLGSIMAGELLARSAGDVGGVFFVPCLIHFGLIGFFILAFRSEARATGRISVAPPSRSTPREASTPAVARLATFAVEPADG